MATSGTYAFAPSTGEIILQALRRCGISRTAVTAEQMLDARQELNFIGSAWSNDGPNLWALDLQTIALPQGTATVNLDPATIDVLDAWITMPDGTDRIVSSISRTTYASYPTKGQQGIPTTFWLDKATPPTVTVYPVPDANGPYVLKFYRSRQTQDAIASGGATPDTPYRFLDALCAALAVRLAVIYAPDRLATLQPIADSALAMAQAEDTEDAPVTFQPGLSGYFRR